MRLAYSAEELTFSYGAVEALHINRLDIRAGERIALVGPNGSGKTTLLHLLAFIAAPDKGTISFFGEIATPDNLLAFRRRAALLLQQSYLFRTSVLTNVEMGLRVRGVSRRKSRRMAQEALDRVGLLALERRSARSLSGGEAQRLALARALVLNPEVLLLDEPSTHMDKAGVQRTEEILLDLNRQTGTTVILTTHNLERVHSVAQRVVNLFRGRVVPAFTDNLFKGEVTGGGSSFETGRALFRLPVAARGGAYVTIDPTLIQVSRVLPEDAPPNTFEGRVVTIAQENGGIRLEVAAGERFHVLMSPGDWDLLKAALGEKVWLTFGENAVILLN